MGELYTRREMLRMSIAGVIGATALGSSIAYGKDDESMPQQKPAKLEATIKTRVFWTWDHCTEWALNRAGAQTLGASNSYNRSLDTFVEDYTKLLEWSGRHNIDAVVVWGLLRDSHGGVESVKKLCDVANKNGVRLLAGVGLNAYGGVYYEGNSPYSLEKHLTDHPDLYGFDVDGNKMAFNFGVLGPRISHHACPSRKENQEFAVESMQWLFKTLPGLGGVQMESGDTGVCQCKLCKERRQHPYSGLSWEDMAMMYPMAVDAIRSVSPDAFIICETYSHPEKYDDPSKGLGFGEGRPAWSDECLEKFPYGVYVQWAGDQFLKPNVTRKWTDAGMISDKHRHHIMRAHYGTYWWGIRGEPAFDWMEDMVKQSLAHGIDGISIFGESSPFEVGSELNYLALENYGGMKNPKADLDIFIDDVAADLLGGEKSARDFLRYARMRTDSKQVPDALKDIYSRLRKLPPDVARRWTWLADYLSSFVYA
ncbi:MAG: hypothetical protein ACYC27_05410 [Armatimonadota bacterium]